ncbi:hypothetical protein KLP28_09550 [Nocardioidaceae bacterium]|nr:hypothetical protein KLP28_09550 [Nocardioidaceae bacterium]
MSAAVASAARGVATRGVRATSLVWDNPVARPVRRVAAEVGRRVDPDLPRDADEAAPDQDRGSESAADPTVQMSSDASDSSGDASESDAAEDPVAAAFADEDPGPAELSRENDSDDPVAHLAEELGT